MAEVPLLWPLVSVMSSASAGQREMSVVILFIQIHEAMFTLRRMFVVGVDCSTPNFLFLTGHRMIILVAGRNRAATGCAGTAGEQRTGSAGTLSKLCGSG